MTPAGIRAHQELLAREARSLEALNGPLTAAECADLLADRLHDAKSFGAPNIVVGRKTVERVIELLRAQVQS